MGMPHDKAPQLPTIVHRRRLRNRLAGVAKPGVVVVSAQAAQGKTTLVADFLTSSESPACWIQLVPEDADPKHFHHHVRTACASQLNLSGNTSYGRKPSTDRAGPPAISGLADFMHRLPADLHLVFDGWHHLPPPSVKQERIETILAARPANGCVFLVSREILPIDLSIFRMRRQALLMNSDELSFRKEEIDVFFQALHDTTLSQEQLVRVQRMTAGWAGGLVLVAEELHRQAGNPDDMVISKEFTDRLYKEARPFFKKEIFRPQTDAMRAFLTAAALLDEVPADVMRAHFGRKEADRLYMEARRQNLFLLPQASSDDRWSFRLHPMFRAFLKFGVDGGRAKASPQPLLRTAAHHYAKGGDLQTAVHYHLQAGETKAAIMGITKIGLHLAIEGRFSEIRKWTAMLPEESLQEDRWLGLLQAISFRIKGGQRTVKDLHRVWKKFSEADHLRGRMLSLAYLIETAVFIGHDPRARERWMNEGQRLLKAASRHPHYTYAKAILWQQIGFGLIAASARDLQKGLSACQNATILGKRIHAWPLVANTLTLAAYAHTQAGEYDLALERLAEARTLNEGQVYPEFHVLARLTKVYLELIRGQIEQAAERLARVSSQIDRFGLIILYPAYLEAAGLVQIYQGQFTALEKTRRHLRDASILLNNQTHGVRADWLAGLGCYHQGRYNSAWAIVSPLIDLPELPVMDKAGIQMLMGFVTLHTGQVEASKTYFESARQRFDQSGLEMAACEAAIGWALSQNARQNQKAARMGLQNAFQTASVRQYQHFPIISPSDLAQACVLCLQFDTSAAADHARYLLKTRLADAERQFLASDRPTDPLTQTIDSDAARDTLYRARIPKLAIQTLGGFQVLLNGTAPLQTKDWQGSRPAMLLKAILAHGGRHIPKDILIEALWPDQDPRRSHQNFKVTLHRLRKLLEPELNAAMGSSYIHLKDNLVSLDPHLCEVDTEAFHRLCKRTRQTDATAETQTLRAMLHRAETLYQGDYLPEELYLTWADMKRSTLREAFVRLMYHLADLLDDKKEMSETERCYRHVIRTEPSQEKACRRLMALLSTAGQPQEAIRLYRDLETYLETEIGAKPAPRTRELYQAINRRLTGRPME